MNSHAAGGSYHRNDARMSVRCADRRREQRPKSGEWSCFCTHYQLKYMKKQSKPLAQRGMGTDPNFAVLVEAFAGDEQVGGRITAIDKSAAMIRLAEKRNRACVAAGRADFRTCALGNAKFRHGAL